MRVTVRLFALARQRAGRAEVDARPARAGDGRPTLKRALAAGCPELAPLVPSLMIAVDAEYAADDTADPARRRGRGDPARQRRAPRPRRRPRRPRTDR